MKKIFLFLGAALVSLAMQAEVVFNEEHNVASWNAQQLPVASYPILANASEGDVIAITVTASTDGRVVLQNTAWEALGNYDAYHVSTGVCAFVLTSAAATEVKTNGLIVTGQNYTFDKVELLYQKTLWKGELSDNAGWAQSGELSKDLFAEMEEGSIVGVSVSAINDGETWHQYAVRGREDEDNGWESLENIIVSTTSEASVKAHVLTAAQATSIKTKNVSLSAQYLDVNALYTYVETKDVTLWSGTQEVADWSGSVRIDASKLTDLKVGNILCVNVSELTEGGQVFLQYDDGAWKSYSAGTTCNYVFSGSDAAPMTVEIPVTYKLEQQLRGNALIVQGQYYTMTKVYVKEGTPVNTVAAYLNVSDAGMATYVLPFDVLSLPDGVQAYELTNDGSEVIMATEVSALEADKPVLIVAAEGEYEFVSEDGASDDISGKTGTFTNGALVGTYTTIDPLAQQTGGNYNYVLNNQGGNVAFYQVKDNSCSVAPYRAYLSCSYPGSTGSSAPAKMRIVFHKDATTGIESQELKANSQKLIRNGQILIIRDGRTYNALGTEVK